MGLASWKFTPLTTCKYTAPILPPHSCCLVFTLCLGSPYTSKSQLRAKSQMPELNALAKICTGRIPHPTGRHKAVASLWSSTFNYCGPHSQMFQQLIEDTNKYIWNYLDISGKCLNKPDRGDSLNKRPCLRLHPGLSLTPYDHFLYFQMSDNFGKGYINYCNFIYYEHL